MQQTTTMPIVHQLPRVSGSLPSLVQLALRLGLGGVFWSSARTKVDGVIAVSENTTFLFEEEYRLPLLSPEFAAHLTTYAEHLFPLMLLLGFGSRIAGLGLLAMASVIQIFVYPDALLSTHLGWIAMAAAIVIYGPGRYSLDHLIFREPEE